MDTYHIIFDKLLTEMFKCIVQMKSIASTVIDNIMNEDGLTISSLANDNGSIVKEAIKFNFKFSYIT